MLSVCFSVQAGLVIESTGNTDGSGNSASSTNSDNYFTESSSPITEMITVTPVMGLEVTQTYGELSWIVEDEINVDEYQVIDVKTGEIIAVVESNNSGSYLVTLPEGVDAKLVVVDHGGLSQTFFPEYDKVHTTNYDLNVGWNLIAITGEKADLSGLGTCWSWKGSGYEMVAEAKPCQGIWVYSENKRSVAVTAENSNAEIELVTGWTLAGPTENSYVPEKSLLVYSWNSIYQIVADDNILLRGVGYWIFSL